MAAISEKEGPAEQEGPDCVGHKLLLDDWSVAYHAETTEEREKEKSYVLTEKVWKDWLTRLDALRPSSSGEEMKKILPRSLLEINEQGIKAALCKEKRKTTMTTKDKEQATALSRRALARNQALKQAVAEEQLKPCWASRVNFVKSVPQTKCSKRR